MGKSILWSNNFSFLLITNNNWRKQYKGLLKQTFGNKKVPSYVNILQKCMISLFHFSRNL